MNQRRCNEQWYGGWHLQFHSIKIQSNSKMHSEAVVVHGISSVVHSLCTLILPPQSTIWFLSSRKALFKKKKWAGENLLQCLQQMLPSCCTSHAHVNYVHHSKFQISACHAVLVQLVQLLVVLYKIFSAFYSAQFNWSLSVWEEAVSLAANVQILPLSATKEVVKLW